MQRLARIALFSLLFVIAGCLFAYVPVAVLCSLPGVRFSTACGHNVYQGFILTIPLSFLSAAILAIWLCGKRR
jgi:hypothetical protein